MQIFYTTMHFREYVVMNICLKVREVLLYEPSLTQHCNRGLFNATQFALSPKSLHIVLPYNFQIQRKTVGSFIYLFNYDAKQPNPFLAYLTFLLTCTSFPQAHPTHNNLNLKFKCHVN